MARVDLIPAKPWHLGRIAANMREMDRIEVGAKGRSPKEALRVSLAASLWAITARVDERPSALMGVAPWSMVEGVGIPFFLGTDEVYHHPRAMLERGRGVLTAMRATFPHLKNVVSVDNVASIRWLKRLGFEVHEDVQNIGGVDFVEFEIGHV